MYLPQRPRHSDCYSIYEVYNLLHVKLSLKSHTSGTTLVEVLVATLLLASFFASLFVANAVCLRFIAASKQSVGAIEAGQARAEVLRNLAFSDLTGPAFVLDVLDPAATPSA